MPLSIDGEKLLEKYKIIWIKIEDLKNMESNAWAVYDNGYKKSDSVVDDCGYT